MGKEVNSKIKLGLGVLVIVLSFSFFAFIFKNSPGSRALSAEAVSTGLTDGNEEVPKYFYFNKNPKSSVAGVSASGFLVGDLSTGEVILYRNKDEKRPIASVSKLMTALVTSELDSGDEVATVSKQAIATYGGNGGFYAGEKIKVSDLVYPLLLESSNDAAEALAEHFDRDIFIRKMNAVAAKLDMTKTSYEDPSGLSQNNISTPEDLFKLAGYLVQEKPDLLKITTLHNYTTKKHMWPSSNQFQFAEGYIGGKSGFTDPARETVISLFNLPLAESGTRPIGIVLLHSTDRYRDVQSILKYLKKNIYYGGEADASLAWVKQKAEIAEVGENDFVTMSFLGDIMLDRGVKNSVLKNFAGDYSKLFSNKDLISLFKRSDIVFANLEGVASDTGVDSKNLYSFRMDGAVVPALAGAGINILSVANNHIGDWGRSAFADTLSRLRENEILYTGGGSNKEESEEPVVMEENGIKIGFLGFSDVGPNFMAAGEEDVGILLASNPRFDEIITKASRQVDYLIVSFHFGEEYETKHNKRQEYLAHKAVDDGAKIVIGTHPHVMQDTEVYGDGFIAYSLGNFIFDQNFSTNTMQGMLLQIKLWKDGSMRTTKNIVKLNRVFQPDSVVKGAEEKVKFKE